MSIYKIVAASALVSAAMVGISSPARADTLTTSGNVAPVCTVTSTARTFDPTRATIQNIAGVVVKCNQPGLKNVTVDALNGQFNGPTNLDYTMTMDLDGGLLPFNNVNLTTAPVSSGIGAPDVNVANGLPGDFSVDLIDTAYLAGTYTETWSLTVA